jgi:hypothetical protein
MGFTKLAPLHKPKKVVPPPPAPKPKRKKHKPAPAHRPIGGDDN